MTRKGKRRGMVQRRGTDNESHEKARKRSVHWLTWQVKCMKLCEHALKFKNWFA